MSLEIKMDDKAIAGLVQSQIQTAVIEHLSKDSELIPNLVKAAMTQETDSDGYHQTGYGRNNFTFLEAVCNNVIQNAVREAIREHVSSKSDEIRKQVADAISKSDGPLVKAVVEGMARSFADDWKMNVQVSLPTNDDE